MDYTIRPNLNKALSGDKAAEYLDVAKSTLDRWRSEGCGPKFVKVGRACRYRPSDMDAWLDGRVFERASDAMAHNKKARKS